ncbi:MAG: DUF3365 domain-containing protein, partial [Alphaproteobacteria bacterium]|nr:DUF3365 domain-containing protein [Alphaproteobacteria bacterium]
MVADGNLRPSVNHQDEADSVPLPATMIHDMSELLAEQDTKVKLYSAFPFPNRSNRHIDDFQQEAWAFLSQNPDGIFVREVEANGETHVRVAIADRMVSQVCVDCHNSHPTSPKTDWQIGDVRGVLEVDSAIGRQLAAGQRLTYEILLTGLVVGLLIAGIIGFTARRAIVPIKAMTGAVARLSHGENVEIDTSRQDEIGDLARSMSVISTRGREALRIKLALDNADASVMVADANLDIVYVNDRLLDMFRAAEADIRRDLPSFSADGLIGTNIDSFHKNPAHQRALLAKLSCTHKAEIKVGGRDFTFIANPVVESGGERLGIMVEWRDLTEELGLRGAIDILLEAVDQGDFSKRIDAKGMQGSAAKLGQGLNALTELVEGATKDLGQMLGGLAEGDLNRRITAEYRGTFGELKNNANRT